MSVNQPQVHSRYWNYLTGFQRPCFSIWYFLPRPIIIGQLRYDRTMGFINHSQQIPSFPIPAALSPLCCPVPVSTERSAHSHGSANRQHEAYSLLPCVLFRLSSGIFTPEGNLSWFLIDGTGSGTLLQVLYYKWLCKRHVKTRQTM